MSYQPDVNLSSVTVHTMYNRILRRYLKADAIIVIHFYALNDILTRLSQNQHVRLSNAQTIRD